jgi:hypothetical protein
MCTMTAGSALAASETTRLTAAANVAGLITVGGGGAGVHDAADAARVPLYRRLVDPFTAEQVLWEFENIFVLSGQTAGAWANLRTELENLKSVEPGESAGRRDISFARAASSSFRKRRGAVSQREFGGTGVSDAVTEFLVREMNSNERTAGAQLNW